MTAQEIAKELDVNPQTVLRVIRLMKKSIPEFFEAIEKTGITKPVYNFDVAQTESVKNRIFSYSRKFRNPALPKPSTAIQRRIWFDEWKERFEEAGSDKWRSVAGVMGLIFLTSDSEFLQQPMMIGRVGDHIAALVDEILGEISETDSFFRWLMESGFSVVNTVL